MLFSLTLFPHLILKSGGQNNGGTKESRNKGTERERKNLLAFFYFTAKLDWADLALTDRKFVEKKRKKKIDKCVFKLKQSVKEGKRMQKWTKRRKMKNTAGRVVISNKNGRTVFVFVCVLSFVRQNDIFSPLLNMAEWITDNITPPGSDTLHKCSCTMKILNHDYRYCLRLFFLLLLFLTYTSLHHASDTQCYGPVKQAGRLFQVKNNFLQTVLFTSLPFGEMFK